MTAQPGAESLNADEQRAWRALLAVATRLPAALDNQLQRESGMTHFEYWVLALLSEAANREQQLSTLAERANASLSRLSHVISKLERSGYVRRKTTPGVRGTRAVLTEKGYTKVTGATPDHVRAIRALVLDALDTRMLATLTELSEAMLRQIDLGIANGYQS